MECDRLRLWELITLKFKIAWGVLHAPQAALWRCKMPSVKHWFPVSHDINQDPEVWELTEQFGDRALRVWLEILSIADRNDGLIGLDYNSITTAVAYKCRCKTTRVRLMLDFITTKGWVHSDSGYRVTNHEKYHRTWVNSKAPTRPNQTRPDHPDLNKTPKPTPQPAAAKRDGPLAELKKLKRPSEEEASRNVELLRQLTVRK